MLHCVTSLSMKFPLSPVACLVVAALSLGAQGAARAQDVVQVDESELDAVPSGALDHDVYATLLPNPDAADPALVKSAISAVLAAPDTRPKTIVPITVAVKPAIKPVRIDPNAVTFGARWNAQDRIPFPVLSALSWDAHADLVSGAAPARAGNVRRSLRITALWDSPEDLSIGFTPGFTRGGGHEFEHYVTGLEVSTVDKTKAARWRSWVELSGEKLAFNNVIENNTAHVAAGASYATSSSTQLDFNVSRGTTWTSNDLTSNVGLSVRF